MRSIVFQEIGAEPPTRGWAEPLADSPARWAAQRRQFVGSPMLLGLSGSSRKSGAKEAQAAVTQSKGGHMKPTVMISAMALLLCCAPALAQQPISCSDFRRNDDGTWTPLKTVTIGAPQHQVQFGPDMSLRPGAVVNGVDLGGLLDVMCGVK